MAARHSLTLARSAHRTVAAVSLLGGPRLDCLPFRELGGALRRHGGQAGQLACSIPVRTTDAVGLVEQSASSSA